LFLHRKEQSKQILSEDQNVAKTVKLLMRPGESNFMVVGLVTYGFVNQSTANTFGGVKTTDKSNSYRGDGKTGLNSVPCSYGVMGYKMLVEFEPSWDGNFNGQIGVNWADISYFLAPGFIARGGYIVLPLVLTQNAWLQDG
jgi:hypothetical protein